MSGLEIRPVATAGEAEACARLMAESEPWLTLGRGYESCLALMRHPERERYVALEGGTVVGFLVLSLSGAFSGYIQSVGVAPDARGHGVGTALVRFAEARVGRESPNVFLCVSDFNAGARRLYEHLGYVHVGTLDDYIVRGHAELLFRRTVGPLAEFQPPGGPGGTARRTD